MVLDGRNWESDAFGYSRSCAIYICPNESYYIYSRSWWGDYSSSCNGHRAFSGGAAARWTTLY